MIQGSVTLITGGAAGLGKATAEFLVQRGGIVVICDLPSSKGQEVAKNLGEDKCMFVPANVASEDDVRNLITTIKDKYGKLNHLVNCAGVYKRGSIYDSKTDKSHDLDDFSLMLNVNTLGTFNVIRLAVGLMSQNNPDNDDGQRGVIINTASITAFDGLAGTVAYSASKAAIAGMTLPLARELSEYGLRVCAIAPGVFDTAINSHARGTKQLNSVIESAPFPKRFGNPTEFAQLVESIIENPMLNGEVIRLDAGIRLHA